MRTPLSSWNTCSSVTLKAQGTLKRDSYAEKSIDTSESVYGVPKETIHLRLVNEWPPYRWNAPKSGQPLTKRFQVCNSNFYYALGGWTWKTVKITAWLSLFHVPFSSSHTVRWHMGRTNQRRFKCIPKWLTQEFFNSQQNKNPCLWVARRIVDGVHKFDPVLSSRLILRDHASKQPAFIKALFIRPCNLLFYKQKILPQSAHILWNRLQFGDWNFPNRCFLKISVHQILILGMTYKCQMFLGMRSTGVIRSPLSKLPRKWMKFLFSVTLFPADGTTQTIRKPYSNVIHRW